MPASKKRGRSFLPFLLSLTLLFFGCFLEGCGKGSSPPHPPPSSPPVASSPGPGPGEVLSLARSARLDCSVLGEGIGGGGFSVYGQLYILQNGRWRKAGEPHFFRVSPQGSAARCRLEAFLGKGVGASVKGSQGELTGRDDLFYASWANPLEGEPPRPIIPDWQGFGITAKTYKIAKVDFKEVRDFVNIPAGLRDAVLGRSGEGLDREAAAPFLLGHLDGKGTTGSGPAAAAARILLDPGDRSQQAAAQRAFRWWCSRWNVKHVVPRTGEPEEQLFRAVGGFGFYRGSLCPHNALVSAVPAIRPDLDEFMKNARSGRGFTEEAGPAVFYALVSAERDRGKIVKLYAAGPLFTSPEQIVRAAARHSWERNETWRLEGWDARRAEVLDGRWCWLSGTRVLVYDDKGSLVDRYFALERTLTRQEFSGLLDITHELALRICEREEGSGLFGAIR